MLDLTANTEQHFLGSAVGSCTGYGAAARTGPVALAPPTHLALPCGVACSCNGLPRCCTASTDGQQLEAPC